MAVASAKEQTTDLDFGTLIDKHLLQLRARLLDDCEKLAQQWVLQATSDGVATVNQKKATAGPDLPQAQSVSTKYPAIAKGDLGEPEIEVKIDGPGPPETTKAEVERQVTPASNGNDSLQIATGLSNKWTVGSKGWELFAEWGGAGGPDTLDHKSTMHTHLQRAWTKHLELSKRDHHIVDEDAPHAMCMISPNSHYRLAWDLLSIPILAFDLTTIPLGVFAIPDTQFMDIMKWITVLFWSTDMVFSFVTGYYNEDGHIELRFSRIARGYLRGRFIFDLIVLLPDWFDMIGLSGIGFIASLRIFRLARIMKLMRVRKIKQILRMIQEQLDSEIYSSIVNVIVLIMAMLFVCHYLGCIWFLLGSQDFDGPPSWVNHQKFDVETWEYQYASVLHWAICQFTPGGMVIQPQNIPERWMAIMVLVFGCLGFSLIISTLTKERLRLERLTSKLDRDTWILWRYLNQSGVPREKRISALRYVDSWIAPKLKRVQARDVELWPMLSKQLQMSLRFEMSAKKLATHPLFAALNHKNAWAATHIYHTAVSESSLAQTEVVFEPQQKAKDMYFIGQGGVDYLTIEKPEEVSRLGAGDWICECALWVPWVHQGIMWVANDCDLIVISSAGLRSAMQEFKLESDSFKRYAKLFVTALNKDQAADDNFGKAAGKGFPVTKAEVATIFHEEAEIEVAVEAAAEGDVVDEMDYAEDATEAEKQIKSL